MKITPLEIRQKSFEKVFRGFDKDEVSAFLLSLSQEWERVLDEQKELRIKLEASQKEVEKLREVESSLFKTLKTAEDTGASMIEQANKAAELQIKESEMKAERLLNEARNKARDIVDNAEKTSLRVLKDLEEEVRNLGETCKRLENYRDNLLSELKHFATNTLERVEKVHTERPDLRIEEQLTRAKQLTRSTANEHIHVTREDVYEDSDKGSAEDVTYTETSGEDPLPDARQEAYNPAEEQAAQPREYEPQPLEDPRRDTYARQEEQKRRESGENRSFFDDIE